MKPVFLSLLLLLALTSSGQEILTVRTQYLNGLGAQAGKFSAFGLGLQLEHFRADDHVLGYLLSYHTNASGFENRDISVNFNGVATKLGLDYRSTMSRISAGGIYLPFKKKAVTPFVSLQSGVMWYRTKILVENLEEDATSCEPMDRKNVNTSFSLLGNAETGLRIRIRSKRSNNGHLQLGVGYTYGTRASYIRLEDDMQVGPKSVAYISRFRAPDGQVHEHPIGTLHRSVTSQITYSIGWSMYIW